MGGTIEGGAKAARANKQRYGENFYVVIGKAGGEKSRGGGFATGKVGADGLTGPQRAKRVGRIGGTHRWQSGDRDLMIEYHPNALGNVLSFIRRII